MRRRQYGVAPRHRLARLAHNAREARDDSSRASSRPCASRLQQTELAPEAASAFRRSPGVGWQDHVLAGQQRIFPTVQPSGGSPSVSVWDEDHASAGGRDPIGLGHRDDVPAGGAGCR
jgi:hypothetical protein